MRDPWGSFQNFINSFRQLANNPAQYVTQRMGIPQEMAHDPDAIVQQWMSEGKVSQAQYNAARKAASQIQNNPMFTQIIGGMR